MSRKIDGSPPGTKVRCVSVANVSSDVLRILKLGGVYTVRRIDYDRVRIDEDSRDNFAFYTWRFELMEDDWDETAA